MANKQINNIVSVEFILMLFVFYFTHYQSFAVEKIYKQRNKHNVLKHNFVSRHNMIKL